MARSQEPVKVEESVVTGPVATNRDAAQKIVLGVDDAPENLIFLQAAVKAGGYPFLGATSGIECLALVPQVMPRLILLDIEMPGMNGLETCKRLRAMPEAQHIPVAFLTGHQTAKFVEAGIAAGGNDFIVKPFDPIKLIERIRYWMSREVESVGRQ
jgi:CheY-like chemotaxis protein